MCIYIYIYIYTHTCALYIYIYIYIHTYVCRSGSKKKKRSPGLPDPWFSRVGQITADHVVLYYMICYVVLYYILYYIIVYIYIYIYNTLYHIILYYIALYYIISYHIILYYRRRLHERCPSLPDILALSAFLPARLAPPWSHTNQSPASRRGRDESCFYTEGSHIPYILPHVILSALMLSYVATCCPHFPMTIH